MTGPLATLPSPDADQGGGSIELSVVLPCLNEAETVETCVRKALTWMAEHEVSGEVVVADNGSTDGSQQLATAAGGRVVDVPVRGYGAALRHGIAAARGRYVVMADADDSYALEDLGPFLDALRGGAELVMGNRFAGGIEPGAMPWLHRYVGNPVLSALGRLFFRVRIGDFHCGMRGMVRQRIIDLRLRTSGMEFASEMIVRASLSRVRITEVPTTLRQDGRTRAPHLRTWRDGWRHLRFLLAFSPRWLLWYPALALVTIGVVGLLALSLVDPKVGDVGFGVHSMLAAATLTIIGVQLGAVAILSRAYAAALGLLPRSGPVERAIERLTLGWGTLAGVLMTAAGFACFVAALVGWSQAAFGQLDPNQTMRLPILGMVLSVLGTQVVMLSFALSLTKVGEL